jgi:hypothetical protein
MSKRAFWHTRIYWITLLGVVIGLPLNKIVLSLSGMLMALNWLIEGDFQKKWIEIKQQKPGFLPAILFIFLAFTLLYSEDVSYGMKDLRIKLPMLLFPVVILSSKPLPKSLYRKVLFAFVVSVTAVTLINFFYFHYFAFGKLGDVRLMSLFDSHIRLSLMVTAASFLCLRTFFSTQGWIKIPALIAALWLIFYTHKSEVLTGYFSFIIALMTLLIWFLFSRAKCHRLLLSAGLLFVVSLICYILYLSVYPIPKEKLEKSKLEKITPLGGIYEHNISSVIMENGHYIHYYVCPKELDSIWQLRTKESLLSNPNTHLYPTLLRYMTALGLRKDAIGLLSLSDIDMKNIRNGFPSPVYAKGGLNARLARITIEIQKHLEGADPNGSTIQQRFEYWKTGLGIIHENFFMGVGIGDIQHVFNSYYALNNSRLSPENRLHTHQQFLTFWIGSGIVGFILFVLYIVLTLRIAIKHKSYELLVFWSIITFSYFFEDTLETQVGVTLATFFITFILRQEQQNPSN